MIQADDIELKKIDQFSRLSGKRILEVGCGDGRLSPFLARKAGMVIAVDTDAARIKAAKAAVPGVTFFVNSGETLCFSAASFDLVFFGYALHHQEGSVALAEARRVLRPGGEILIIEPTVESEYTQLVAVFQKEEPDLLTKAQDAIQASSHAIVRRETFVVHHFFDTQKAFLDHYVTSYAGGPASQDERQALLDIIGKKRFEKTICVEDECTITLLSGNQQPHGDSRAHAGRTACS